MGTRAQPAAFLTLREGPRSERPRAACAESGATASRRAPGNNSNQRRQDEQYLSPGRPPPQTHAREGQSEHHKNGGKNKSSGQEEGLRPSVFSVLALEFSGDAELLRTIPWLAMS